jgi:hypothetical protein
MPAENLKSLSCCAVAQIGCAMDPPSISLEPIFRNSQHEGRINRYEIVCFLLELRADALA